MWQKCLISVLLMLSVEIALTQPTLGGEFPTKPIEILCAYTPGSPTDLASRLIAEKASKYLGGTVIVVNKTGAAGGIAAADVISSKPDGYKLATLAVSYFALTTKMQKVPFDPNDLIPIISFMELKAGMSVKVDSPWKTFNDLLDYAKKNPGMLRWSTTGRGNTIHISGLIIFRKAGVEAIHLPYKGSPEQTASVLGGHVDAVSAVYGTVKEHIAAGKLRWLISFSSRRYSIFPDVPTVVELGFPDAAKFPSNFSFYVHKDTPENIKKILTDAFKKTFTDPEFKKRFETIGEELRVEGPEFVKEATKKMEEVGVPILKELGLYVGK